MFVKIFIVRTLKSYKVCFVKIFIVYLFIWDNLHIRKNKKKCSYVIVKISY